MYIGNTPIQTAESENTGMTLYCGTGKELPEFEKPQTVSYTHLYTDQKDLQLEKKVKQLLNNNELQYESYESFLESENMYLKAYEIEI